MAHQPRPVRTFDISEFVHGKVEAIGQQARQKVHALGQQTRHKAEALQENTVDALKAEDDLTDENRALAGAEDLQPRIARLPAAVSAACHAEYPLATTVWQADGPDTLDALSAHFEARAKRAQAGA